MASSADGSIRIDTELDNSGFDRGSDKLLSALRDLKDSVDTIGDTLSDGLNAVIKALQALSSQATDTNQQVTQSAQQAAAANQDVAQAAQAAAQASAQSGQAAAQAGQQVQQSAQAAAQATQAMAAGPRNLTTEYNSIGRTAASLHDQITRLSTAAEIGFKNDGQILRFRDNVDIVARKVEELRNRVNAFADTKIPTDEYKWMQNEIEKTKRELAALDDRQARMDSMGIDRSSVAYRRLQYDIDLANRKLGDYMGRLTDMEVSGEAFTLGSNTAEYQNMSGVLSQLENELSDVQATSSTAQLSLSRTHPILTALATAVQKAGSAFLAMGKAVAKAALNTAQAAIKKLGNGLMSIASGAKRAIAGLLGFNRTAKASANPVNALIKGLTSFKRMLISRIKETFISQIFQSMREGIQQFALYSSEFNTAMSNIKNTGSQMGAQIGSLVANVITVIEPVLTRILSLINSVIVAISALFAKLTGKSTVAVAAKGTGSYADSLKDAGGAAGKAAKEQKKFNAELYGWDELTRQNKTEDADKGGGAGASGPSWSEVPVDDILKDWEDMDWFQLGYDWAEKMANALASIPWVKIQDAAYRIGQHLAEFMNGVFANLHFADSLGTTIAEALNTGLSFALGFLETFDFAQFGVWAGTLWNAFVNAFDFDKLASVITLGGNGIISAFTTFFQTIASTCETLGGGLAKIFNAIFVGIDFGALSNAFLLGVHDFNLALKGFVDGVDWDGAAQNIINGANTLIRGMVLDENGNLTNVWGENGTQIGRLIGNLVSSLGDIIAGLDYKALGANIALWLTNAFAEVDFQKLGNDLANGFNGLVTFFSEAIRNIDWLGLCYAIGEGISNAVIGIDWSNIGVLLSNGVGAILDGLNGLLMGVDWLKLGISIFMGLGEAIASIDWLGLIVKVLALLLNVFIGAVGLLVGALAGIGIGLSKAVWGIGKNIIGGLFEGICAALSGIFNWLKENIFDPIVNGVKSLFGINSPSTVFAEMGDFLIQGLLKGISGAWESITSFFSGALDGIKTAVSGAWENIKTGTATAWDNVKMGLSTAWTNIKTTVATAASTVKTNVTTAWNNLKTNTQTAYENIRSTIQTKFNSAKTAVSTAVSNMKTNAVTGWQNMVSNASAKFQSIYSTCQSKMSSVTSHLKGIQWGSIGTNLVNGLLNGLKSAWNSVTSWISSATSGLTNKVKSILGIASPSKEWAKIGVYLDQGLTNGLQTGERSLLNSASVIASNLTDRMTDANGTMQFTNDADIARLDIVTGKLSGIAAIIDHISAALASMGGLQIPQIAMGTVAPYRTKAAAAGGGGYDAGVAGDGYTAEMVQLLRNIRDYLAAGGSRGDKDIKVIIDGREVFNAVVNENNRAITRSGGVSPLRV